MSDMTHIIKPSIIYNINIHAKAYDPKIRTCFCCNSHKDFDNKFEVYINEAIKEGFLTEYEIFMWRTMKNNNKTNMDIDHGVPRRWAGDRRSAWEKVAGDLTLWAAASLWTQRLDWSSWPDQWLGRNRDRDRNT